MMVSCNYKFMSCRHEVLSISTSILTLEVQKKISQLQGEIFQNTKIMNIPVSRSITPVFLSGAKFFQCGGWCPEFFICRNTLVISYRARKRGVFFGPRDRFSDRRKRRGAREARREGFLPVRKSIPRAEKNKPSLRVSVRILFSIQREAEKRPYFAEPLTVTF